MARNLVNGTNIIVEESGDNINMNLSSTYNTNLQQEINDSFIRNNIYSTTETVVGTWIDGKSIYRRVISLTPTGSEEHYLHNISNIDKILNYHGVCKRANPWTFVNLIPCNYTNWEIYLYDFNLTQFTLIFSTNQWEAGIDWCYITVEYTKTTD